MWRTHPATVTNGRPGATSALLPRLYREIDQLKVQPDFLEETSGSPHLTFLRKTLASLHSC